MILIFAYIVIGAIVGFTHNPVFQFYFRTSPVMDQKDTDRLFHLKMAVAAFWCIMLPMGLFCLLVERIRGA